VKPLLQVKLKHNDEFDNGFVWFIFMYGTISFLGNHGGKEYIESLPKSIDWLAKLQWGILDTALAQLSEAGDCSLPRMTLFAAKAMAPEFLVPANNIDAFITQFKAFVNTANFNQLRLSPGIGKS